MDSDRQAEHTIMDVRFHKMMWMWEHEFVFKGVLHPDEVRQVIEADIDWRASLPLKERRQVVRRRWAYDLCGKLYKILRVILRC